MAYPLRIRSELGSGTPANRKRWTREDCDSLERVGLLKERYELLDGEIILKGGQGQPHAMTVSRLMGYFFRVFGMVHLQIHAEIEVADADALWNFPQPDVAILSRPDFEYKDTPPGNELRLVVEESYKTLVDDLRTKAALYARAEIPEYWVLDITGRRLLVHRNPTPEGYTTVTAFTETQEVATLAAPDNPVLIADLLPPQLAAN